MPENNGPSIDVSKFRLENLSAYAVKAELYIVSLTFSILALSIQFQIETSCKYAAWSEVAGWVLLTISGASGLKMLRNISSEYSYILGKYRYIEKSNQKKEGMSKLDNELFAEMMEEWAGEVRGQNYWLSPIQGYCLFSGLAFLIVARILANPLLW